MKPKALRLARVILVAMHRPSGPPDCKNNKSVWARISPPWWRPPGRSDPYRSPVQLLAREYAPNVHQFISLVVTGPFPVLEPLQPPARYGYLAVPSDRSDT